MESNFHFCVSKILNIFKDVYPSKRIFTIYKKKQSERSRRFHFVLSTQVIMNSTIYYHFFSNISISMPRKTKTSVSSFIWLLNYASNSKNFYRKPII